MCVCGKLLVDQGEATNWEPPIIQISEHLKKMNVDLGVRSSEDIYREAQDALKDYRGNDDPKPVKPEGDDPRAGSVYPPHYARQITDDHIRNVYIGFAVLVFLSAVIITVLNTVYFK